MIIILFNRIKVNRLIFSQKKSQFQKKDFIDNVSSAKGEFSALGYPDLYTKTSLSIRIKKLIKLNCIFKKYLTFTIRFYCFLKFFIG
mgnify:CR=1 FL=1